MHIPFYPGGLLDNGGKAGHSSALVVPLTLHLRITFTLIAVSMVISLAGRQAGRQAHLAECWSRSPGQPEHHLHTYIIPVRVGRQRRRVSR